MEVGECIVDVKLVDTHSSVKQKRRPPDRCLLAQEPLNAEARSFNVISVPNMVWSGMVNLLHALTISFGRRVSK